MIKWTGRQNEKGEDILEVYDYSREKAGAVEIHFRPKEKDEPVGEYLDKIMNKYWWQTGKNKRRYHELD